MKTKKLKKRIKNLEQQIEDLKLVHIQALGQGINNLAVVHDRTMKAVRLLSRPPKGQSIAQRRTVIDQLVGVEPEGDN